MRNLLTRDLAVELGKLRLKKHREEKRRFVIEGERLVADAWRAGARVSIAVVEHERAERYKALLEEMEAAGIPVLETTPKLFEKIAETREPQGIALVAYLPVLDARAALASVPEGYPAAVLWGVSDPGNFGTMIRTTDWFGAKGLLFSSGSADPFNAKVVRGSMGSLFRVRLGEITTVDELHALAEESGRELVATVAEDGTEVGEWKASGREILVFGGEAHGLPDELLESIPRRIRIAGGSAESLNLGVSHGILIHALTAVRSENV
ncbi:MAG: RNA methyltransferase [Bacteroidetes bacterium]|nr:RNA methyltransferase [Bacteroidota bacterium]